MILPDPAARNLGSPPSAAGTLIGNPLQGVNFPNLFRK